MNDKKWELDINNPMVHKLLTLNLVIVIPFVCFLQATYLCFCILLYRER